MASQGSFLCLKQGRTYHQLANGKTSKETTTTKQKECNKRKCKRLLLKPRKALAERNSQEHFKTSLPHITDC